MTIRTILPIAVLLGLASCEGGLLAPDDADPSIRTSADEYVFETTSIGWEIRIPFRYENRSEGPYFLPNCNGTYEFRLEKWLGDRWAAAFYPVLQACLSPVIRIESGDAFVDTIGVLAAFPGNNFHPKFEIGEPEGEYRIVLETLSSYQTAGGPFGPAIPFDDRVSNSFRLRTDESPVLPARQ